MHAWSKHCPGSDCFLRMSPFDSHNIEVVNRRTSPNSALCDYIAQLHIIERRMHMRTSGVVLTALSARTVTSFYIWLQLHFFSHPCTQPL